MKSPDGELDADIKAVLDENKRLEEALARAHVDIESYEQELIEVYALLRERS